jgi:hypothetical protein
MSSANSAANPDRETGSVFMPRFDAQGLMIGIAVDWKAARS